MNITAPSKIFKKMILRNKVSFAPLKKGKPI